MALRTGPYFNSSRFIKGASIQHRPPKLPLFEHNSMPKPTFIKIDRHYRPVDEVPNWVTNSTVPSPVAGTKRRHEKIDDDHKTVESQPRKKHLKQEEWAILKYSKPLLCCIEFLVSWTPARLEMRRKEWERKVLMEEMEHLKDLQEQLKEHPHYIIVNGYRLNPADAGYVIGSPTASSSSNSSSESPITPPHTTEQGTHTSPSKSLDRPAGAPRSGPYYPGAPPPPSHDGEEDTPRPPKPSGGAGKSYIQTISSYYRTPTPTQPGVHRIDLPGGLTHVTGPPIHTQPVDMEGYKARLPLRDDLGRLVDKKGRLMNEQGLLVNAKGQLVDKKGRRIPKLSEDKLPDEPITGARRPPDQPPPPPKPLNKPQLVDEYGRFMDEQGRLMDEKGRLVNAKGQLVDERGYLVDEYGRIPAYLLGKEEPLPTKRPPTPKVSPPKPQATQYQAPSVEEDPEGSYTPKVSPKKQQTTYHQAPSFEEVPVRAPTPSDRLPPPQAPDNDNSTIVEASPQTPTPKFDEEEQLAAHDPHSPPDPSQLPQFQPQSPPQYRGQPPIHQTKSPRWEPQSPTPIAVRPLTPRPPFVENVEIGERDEFPATRPKRRPQGQLESPAFEPNSKQASTNPLSEVFKNLSALWPTIANPFSQMANAAAVSTADPTNFLDNIVVSPETLAGSNKPGRMPFVDEEEDEQQKKNKKDKSKEKPVEDRTPEEKFLALEEVYTPLPPRTRIIGTPRGRYGPRLAPELVRGEDLPRQKLGADKTFKTRRELCEHKATHDYWMSGAFGPAGSMGHDMRPVSISPEERKRLLRDRENERRPFPVDQSKLALERSRQEERQRVEREKKAKERAERLLTEGDFAEEMTQEEFEEQFDGNDSPAPGGVHKDEEKMTGEEYQQQLLDETIGDEAPDPNAPQTYADPNFQQTYTGNTADATPMTAEEYQRLLDQYALQQAQLNAEISQLEDMQRVYTDEEVEAMYDEQARREFEGF
ncbi:uncharacterized protein CC84DRAFT_1231261 [Paraphaeosphaeria sporulosa]|uniref:Uncharacterized protein n=1 Tax=Paraphaeosphaeria sporulosa TaxID=1460663 RepID=A0A177BZ18_9PLEO|nr:uncharacterized protein CC84DRAFT_1231261 [Paraphaeosphaeria sporulosa]OAF99938.1 hypothetical protein CC84DRAFT_1231261 [Paraphaeosphaeria sporulosa]